MATLNLGRIKPVFRGAWTSGAFVIDDIVTHGNESFICIQAGTNKATSDASYWTKLAAKGTDGTDVGTTITTQGDILYRDGSGLQRLAKGTASQELRMNSGATAPEWHTPAVATSDYVKLASVSATSGTGVSIDGYFNDSIYAMYKIIMYDYESDSNDWWKLRYNTGGSAVTSNSYRWSGQYNRRDGSSNSTAVEGGNSVNYIAISWWGANTADQPMISEITFTQPQATDQTKPALINTTSNDNGKITRFDVGSNFDSQTAATGLTLYPTGGNITRFNATLYGVKL